MNLFKVNKLIIFVVFKYYCKIVKLVFVLSMNIIREIYIRKKDDFECCVLQENFK